MTLAPSTRLGPYEIQAAIGAGGMGAVYKAKDTRLDRSVAIKVLPREVSADPDRRARFDRESKTSAGNTAGQARHRSDKELPMRTHTDVVRTALLVSCLVLASACLAPASAQTPPQAAAGPEYLLLNTSKTATLRKELMAAGQQGFVIHSACRYSFLLARVTSTPRVYQIVATTGDATLVKELNDYGAKGFRLVPASATEFGREWVVALEKQAGEHRYAYTVIKGDDGAQAALDTLRRKGGRLVAIVGKQAQGLSLHPAPILIVEEGDEGEPDTGRPHEFRVVSTMKMSTLLKEVREHVSNGLRPIGAGFMAVVMERDPDVTAPLIEVDLVDTVPPYGLKAINDLAAQGFRVIPKASSLLVADAGIVTVVHLVFLLQRVPGAAEKYEYSFIDARDKAAAQLIGIAGAQGFVPVGLIGGLLIVERTARAEVR